MKNAGTITIIYYAIVWSFRATILLLTFFSDHILDLIAMEILKQCPTLNEKLYVIICQIVANIIPDPCHPIQCEAIKRVMKNKAEETEDGIHRYLMETAMITSFFDSGK